MNDPRCDDVCQRDPFCLPERWTMLGPVPTGLVGDATTTDLVTPHAGTANTLFRVMGSKRVPCIGRPCDRVLVEGKVLAFSFNLAPPGLPQRQVAFEERAMSSCRSVKLRAQRCNYPGWVYFDSDSHVTLPGGDDIEVQALAPFDWLVVPSDGPLPFEPPSQVTEVEVRVRACLLTCCTATSGRLTWWSSEQDSGALMLRPPRATELAIIVSAGGAPTPCLFGWQDIGAPVAGPAVFNINNAFLANINYPGAGEQLILQSAAPLDIMYVWRIE